ncbi:MAG: dockerin type I domain-containing protein, partial [Oscillospiraceae bacterium]|nr:dockerin type I domain-containing protein [Oscillospiraceae bacterium]
SQTIAADGSTEFIVRFTRLNYSLRLVQEGDPSKGQAFSVRWGTPIAALLADFENLSENSTNTMEHKYGHKFDCWLDSDSNEYNTADVTLPVGGLTLCARYTTAAWPAAFSYTAREEYSDAVSDESYEYEVDFGAQITPPSIRRYGYSLAHWEDDSSKAQYKPDELALMVMNEEGRSFTAVWEPNTYDVTFNYYKTIGEGSAETTTAISITIPNVEFDDAFDLPEPVEDPHIANTATAWDQETGRVLRGHRLEDWTWTDDDLKDHSAVDSDEPDPRPKMLLEGGMVLTANQPVNQYPAVFTWVGGTQTIGVDYGTSIDDAIKDAGFVWLRTWGDNDTQSNTADYEKATIKAKRTGYSIDGWKENRKDGVPDGDYQVMGTILDERREFNADDHARSWNADFYLLTDYYDDTGELHHQTWEPWKSVDNVEFGSGIKLPENPSPTQYFTGWYAGEAFSGNPLAYVDDTEVLMAAEGMTFYAKFVCPIEYRIGGSVYQTVQLTQGSTIEHITPTPPTGSYFEGWTEGDFGFALMPRKKLTITGYNQIKTFTVQFEYTGSDGKTVTTAKEEYVYGKKILLPSGVPSSLDTTTHKFTGWKFGSTTIVPGTTTTPNAGVNGYNIVIKAQYSARKLQKITATLPSGTTFSQGSVIDLGAAGLVVYAEYDNGIKEQVLDILALLKNKSVTYTPQTFTTAGSPEITITYKTSDGESASCKLKVQVTPRRPISVAIAVKPAKTTYLIGEKLDLRGGMLEIRYDNGTRTTTTPLTLTSANEFVTVSNFASTAAGKRMLNVKYTYSGQSFTTQFEVSIVKPSTAWLKGDVNNDKKVNSLDLLLVKRHILGIATLSGDAFNAADINGDGKVNSVDSMKILRHILGIETLK